MSNRSKDWLTQAKCKHRHVLKCVHVLIFGDENENKTEILISFLNVHPIS